ncbi:MAG: hypothetical protein ACI9UT_002640, partial [Flavobacteriales bacterium]
FVGFEVVYDQITCVTDKLSFLSQRRFGATLR